MRVKEHLTAVLPFELVEKIVGKPLRICGVAMRAGTSENFNSLFRLLPVYSYFLVSCLRT